MMELVAGAVAAGLAGGLTETGQRVARGAWGRLASLTARRDAPAEGTEPITDQGEESASPDGAVRAAEPGAWNVVVNGGQGIACGNNITQSNYFR
ncbi:MULTISPECIES: hypothetical protein [Streptomyces]|uniref:Uncharacterized protein n=1 Tax=Streptomyces tsukubensis (strain DSM 42081 / NBRC 108919 / NRRL 18488 / 9993) TaxID=1114943 RepID=I2NB85_STRT9|nr:MULTISPECIES: hypothetical protein [Streptomyces]AZK97999.1 hypothetical protein B7R87_31995 [Streptomyces tsukubensis]EIF94282.1 hypothetical protein [Streptomyces tsukubensis NRRL18488]MYS64415.1 hypothetical protein [Streptomyces sp. SID5473]QKM66077.1 hypothetical protein STSU_001785 [Streptomyces tsukubensis NRRL18488]TAI42358.1 hypothetical protein EWI31_22525 [Streptomyces tsukubensis]